MRSKCGPQSNKNRKTSLSESSSLCLVWTKKKAAVCKPGRESSPESNLAGSWPFSLQNCEKTWICCLCSLVNGVLLWHPEPCSTNTYLFWRNLYLSPLPIFELGLGGGCCCCWVLNILNINPLSDIWFANIFSQPCMLLFYSAEQNWTDILTLDVFAFRRRQWHPTPVLLPGISHGWRSLVG